MELQNQINKKIEECKKYVFETLEKVGCDNISCEIKYYSGEWECEVSANTSLGEFDERVIYSYDIDSLLEMIKEEV